MAKLTRTDSKNTRRGTNGSGQRKCESWIERFISYAHTRTESCELYTRWSAITALGAILEQKVWLSTPDALFPNLYTILVGPPSIGKSRAIGAVRGVLAELTDIPIAPTSTTMASLVDALKEAERNYIIDGHAPVFYNTLFFIQSELRLFLKTYEDGGLISGLTEFYDVQHPYTERRRTGDLRIEIKRPQLSMLGGITPADLFDFIPENAWSQGFTSRIILVYSEDRTRKTVRFTEDEGPRPEDLIHDLQIINSLIGGFSVTSEAEKALRNWVELDEPPKPTHRRLEHYLGRRYPHLLKLCMVSSVDRGNSLVIDVGDFNRGLGWLIEVEQAMPRIFQEGPRTAESKVMDEVHYFITQHDITGLGVPESKIKSFILARVSSLTYTHFWTAMESAGFVKRLKTDKVTGESRWAALPQSGRKTNGT